jgi:hypoxanthine phosphoribosyltransferase
MFKDDWKPSYIIGLTRGGLAPAVLLSNKTGIPMHTLDVRLRDTFKGYEPEKDTRFAKQALQGKTMLIVDDINDTGETLEWIYNDWKGSWPSKESKTMWHSNVRVACLVNNEGSNFEIDYSSVQINKIEDPQWVVFPWEE